MDSLELEADLCKTRIENSELRHNLVFIKNKLLDQAGLLKALKSREKEVEVLKYENEQFTKQYQEFKQTQNTTPLVVESLKAEIEVLKQKLASQEYLIEQLQSMPISTAEREVWKVKEQNFKRTISEKDKKIAELKALLASVRSYSKPRTVTKHRFKDKCTNSLQTFAKAFSGAVGKKLREPANRVKEEHPPEDQGPPKKRTRNKNKFQQPNPNHKDFGETTCFAKASYEKESPVTQPNTPENSPMFVSKT